MTTGDIADFRRRVALQRYWSCVRKQCFNSEAKAQQAAEKLNARRDDVVEYYACSFCDHWHIGRPSAKAARRNREALSMLLALSREVTSMGD